jgi:hypothetical protein
MGSGVSERRSPLRPPALDVSERGFRERPYLGPDGGWWVMNAKGVPVPVRDLRAWTAAQRRKNGRRP